MGLMRIEKRRRLRAAGPAGMLLLAIALTARAAEDPGAALYAERCAQCHDHPDDRIPPRPFLKVVKTPEQVVQTLTSGIMQSHAAGLAPEQIAAIATFVTGKPPGANHDPDPKANLCPDAGGPIRFSPRDWNGWGHDVGNSRYQPAPGFISADIPRLKVKWVFAYPGNVADGEPTIVGDRLFAPSRAGRVFSLDARTGCTRWSFDAEGGVRTAIEVAPMPQGAIAKVAAYFATENGYLHAVDARSGKTLWTTRVEDHPVGRLTGSPVAYKGSVYVTLASLEETSIRDPGYYCCTFRGGVVAVEAITGKIRWKTHTILEEPKRIGANSAGTPQFGPAGATIFSPVTIDPKRNVLYVGTGNSYTQVSTDAANAIMALDLATGARRWVRQVMPEDDACPDAKQADLCQRKGPDFDFAAPPVLRRLPGGKEILVAESKAEEAYALDPDRDGEIIWRVKLGQGSRSAGPWGLAADDRDVFMGGADVRPAPGVKVGGLTALDIATGEIRWRVPALPAACSWEKDEPTGASSYGAIGCTQAQTAAVTLVPGAVLSGSIDGHIRAFSTTDGALIWDFDTAASPYAAVNGAKAKGGSINYGGQTVANGVLYVNSGAGGLHQPGNALIAFTIDGK
jgi:polyvinyl alcohol dehydrogenase (cytochrome)